MTTEAKNKIDAVFQRLCGSSLGNVVFVEDYFQFSLGIARVSVLTSATLKSGSSVTQFGTHEFQARLKGQVGATLTAFSSSDAGVTLTMDNGTQLTTIYDDPDQIEHLVLDLGTEGIWVI